MIFFMPEMVFSLKSNISIKLINYLELLFLLKLLLPFWFPFGFKYLCSILHYTLKLKHNISMWISVLDKNKALCSWKSTIHFGVLTWDQHINYFVKRCALQSPSNTKNPISILFLEAKQWFWWCSILSTNWLHSCLKLKEVNHVKLNLIPNNNTFDRVFYVSHQQHLQKAAPMELFMKVHY